MGRERDFTAFVHDMDSAGRKVQVVKRVVVCKPVGWLNLLAHKTSVTFIITNTLGAGDYVLRWIQRRNQPVRLSGALAGHKRER